MVGCSEGLGGETAGIAAVTAAALGVAAEVAGTTGEGSATVAVVLLVVPAVVPVTAAPKLGELGGDVDVGRLPPSRSLSEMESHHEYC